MNEPFRGQIWNERIEEYIIELKLTSEEEADKCGRMAIYNAKCRNCWGLPSLILPAVLSPLSQTLKDEYYISYINCSGFILVGIFSCILAFFNYGKRSEQFFNVEGRFRDLITDINECLCKHPNNRGECSMVLRTFRMRFDTLNESIPNLY